MRRLVCLVALLLGCTPAPDTGARQQPGGQEESDVPDDPGRINPDGTICMPDPAWVECAEKVRRECEAAGLGREACAERVAAACGMPMCPDTPPPCRPADEYGACIERVKAACLEKGLSDEECRRLAQATCGAPCPAPTPMCLPGEEWRICAAGAGAPCFDAAGVPDEECRRRVLATCGIACPEPNGCYPDDWRVCAERTIHVCLDHGVDDETCRDLVAALCG